jgi:membrane associated rhomboid family serine protease
VNAVIPLRDDIPARRAPVVTWALIAVNVLVFLYQSGLPHRAAENLIILRGLLPGRYTHPDLAAQHGLPPDAYLSFLTSMFLHGSWLHLIANMWSLWIFGDNVEDRMGRGRFVLFYLLCGLAAGALHVLTNRDSFVPTIGASGAIAGVLGAYFLLFPRARVLTLVPIVFIPLFFELPAITFLLIWFALQLVQAWAGMGMEGGGVAWWAHVGGFGAGILLHRLFLARDPPPPRWSNRRYAPD